MSEYQGPRAFSVLIVLQLAITLRAGENKFKFLWIFSVAPVALASRHLLPWGSPCIGPSSSHLCASSGYFRLLVSLAHSSYMLHSEGKPVDLWQAGLWSKKKQVLVCGWGLGTGFYHLRWLDDIRKEKGYRMEEGPSKGPSKCHVT